MLSRRRRLTILSTGAAATVALATAGVIVAGSAQAAAGCRVTYTVSAQWSGGFNADVTVTNLGDALNGWRLTWTFPDSAQRVTSAWNAQVSQSDSTVTAGNVAYNASLGTGGSASFGFGGASGSSNPVPSSFALNGTTCTGAATTSSPTSSPSPSKTTSPTPTASPSTSPSPSKTTSPTPTPTSTSGRTWSTTADGFAAGTTGGAGGTTVTVSNQSDLEKYASASGKYVIRVSGTIAISPYGKEVQVASDKTIVGVGTTGRIYNGGFKLHYVSNVIIRNLTIGDTLMADDDPDDKLYDYDGIQMDGSSNVWIDHNRISRTNDGLIDSRQDTTNLTVSWNDMGYTNKSFGIGWTENVTARMTIHHNWIHHTNSRNPSTDNVAYAHLYNNYLQSVTGYGNYSRGYTKMVLENSYFQSVANPYYPDSTAQLKQSGSICSSCSGKQQTSGSAFTPSQFYSYQLDSASTLPSLLKQYTGPQATISH